MVNGETQRNMITFINATKHFLFFSSKSY